MVLKTQPNIFRRHSSTKLGRGINLGFSIGRSELWRLPHEAIIEDSNCSESHHQRSPIRMPRLSRQLLATAWKENVLLPPLLRSCRDLRSARLELKWLREHAQKVARRYGLPSFQPLLSRICHQRSRGKPLQYILGTEFFGELELKCRPGVLIPRYFR